MAKLRQQDNFQERFQERVFGLTKKIPKGKITSYGEIAKVLHSSPRAVGQALSKNPQPIIVPCHRVVRSDGSLGGYSGGVKKKMVLLREEGIKIKGNKIVNFADSLLKLRDRE